MKRFRAKRTAAVLLALALAFPMLPKPVFAEVQTPEMPGTCPCCDAAAEAIDWSVLTADLFANNTITQNQHVTMDRDVELTGQMEIATDAHLLLDLNGHTLTAAGGRVFHVAGGLTVFDSSAEKTGTIVGGDVSATGAANYGGGTVRLEGGTFTLLSGTVTGGRAALGGNLYVDKNSTATISGGTLRDGYAVGVDSSSGRGGNIYALGAVEITGDARILNGYAQYGTGNSGRGGNVFVQAATVTLSGNAILAFGYADSRGGNLLVNSGATLLVQENAEIYGGVAKSYGNNIDVMTAHLNIAGGTIYGSPVGGGKNNVNFYKAASTLTITGGKIYGKVAVVAGMAINISGAPYVEQLYLPTGALVIPGAFEKTAWVGLEVEAEDQTFTGPLTDFGCYMFFFPYDKQGLTWYHKNTDNSLYLTTGTPCQCCGEDVVDIEWTAFGAQTKLTDGHYKLTKDVTLTQTASILVEGSVTLDLNGYILTGSGEADVFQVAAGSTFNVTDMSSGGEGFVKGNGHRALYVTNDAAVVNLYNGSLTGSVTGNNVYGGTVYLSNGSVLNIYGGAVTNGFSQDHGGNIFAKGGATVNLYGGAVSNGLISGGTTATGIFVGNGANVYLTGADTTMNIYNGLVDTGINESSAGGNIFINSGASCYMYGGTVENGGAKERGANIYVGGNSGEKYSLFHMYGGSIGMVDMALGTYNSIYRKGDKTSLVIWGGKISAHQDLSEFVAPCACYKKSDVTYTVWNYGHTDRTCDENCPMELAWGKDYVKTLNTGSHDYVASGENTCTCALCGNLRYDENMVCVVGGQVYTDINTALEDCSANSVLRLLGDLTAGELAVGSKVTLDLNGHTLTADAITAATGHVIDSANGKGLLRCDSLALNSANAQLPVALDEGVRFCSMTPDVTLERLDTEVVRLRFTFKERSADTIIDDLIKAGNSDLSVELKLTWTKDGEAKEKIYVCNRDLLVKYAQKWDSRRYVVTVTCGEGVSDLTCAVQLSSSAAGGTTFSAEALKNVEIINQKLTWDAINAFPIKTKDMTVAEMRQLCVDFMAFTKTYLWTPDQTVNFKRSASGGSDSMEQGQIYGGLPYVGLGSGNVYRMMDYIDPATGLVDMEKAIPALKNGGTLATADLKYFGSQCSESVYWAWGRVMNSANYAWSYSVTPYNGFIWLGDIQIDDITNWSAAYNTDVACAANGRQAMYGAYAQLQKADGLVYYVRSGTDNGAGHLVMSYSDAYVVYNEDGTIDGDQSYVLLIDQAQKWTEATNAAGDTYQHKTGVGVKHTFKKLYDSGYIPFTFAEFLGQASIEDTQVWLTKEKTDLISGTIRESDRAYITDLAADTLTWDDIFASHIRSNYGVADVYVTLYNTSGREFYRHAVRSGTAGNKALAMEESGEMVTVWQLADIAENSSYSGKIEVQLGTGERVVIFEGNITT